MSRSKSSHQWLQEHEKDPYVGRARAEATGRERVTSFEIEERYQLCMGQRVLDLGAAQGVVSGSQAKGGLVAVSLRLTCCR